MARAIAVAREGLATGQTPFGAAVVRDGKVLAAAHNNVWADCDPTAHAEILALREASRVLQSVDLSGCEIYSTCEPCPMCFTAIHWAKLPRVVYGASIADAERAGFSELRVSNEQLKTLGGSGIEIVAGFEREACVALFDEWLARDDHRVY
jgi:tRNA(Arg) A34 adenosine deaminase TadA